VISFKTNKYVICKLRSKRDVKEIKKNQFQGLIYTIILKYIN